MTINEQLQGNMHYFKAISDIATKLTFTRDNYRLVAQTASLSVPKSNFPGILRILQLGRRQIKLAVMELESQLNTTSTYLSLQVRAYHRQHLGVGLMK